MTLILVTMVAVTVVYLAFRRMKYWQHFQHIPGPKEMWLLGNALHINPVMFHGQLNDWSKQFGHIYKLRLPDGYMIVVSGYDEIVDMLHNTGLDLAGRYVNFRYFHHFKDTGLANRHPDAKWKLLRKVVQRQLKQYGEGMMKMENIVAEISMDMFFDFGKASNTGLSLDPLAILRCTAMKTIALLICGERLTNDDSLVGSLLQYEECVFDAFGALEFDYLLLDLFPSLLRVPLRSSNCIKRVDKVRDSVAAELKRLGLKHEGSLMRQLHEHFCEGVSDTSGFLTEDDVVLTSVNVLLGAVATSSVSFYCLLNILAHRKDVQEKLWKEIQAIDPNPEERIKLDDRSRMPYSRSVIFELLRYHSITPMTPRLAIKDTEICGTRIPKGAVVAINAWTLHHDPTFWEEPEEFRPERFLDDNCNLLSPDHPRRKHLMPFSSGVRVCPGEQFAVARLFLWLTNFIKRFEVCPAENNDASMLNLDKFKLTFLLYPPNYEVFLTRRHYMSCK